MKSRYSLRARVILAMLVVATVSSALFAGAIYVTNERLERELMSSLVDRETAKLEIQLQDNGEVPAVYSSGTRIYRRNQHAADPVPEQLARLEPGYHHNVEFNDRAHHVGIHDLNGDRVYVAMDFTDFERKERKFESIALLGAVLVPVLAICVGAWLSRTVVAPGYISG